MKNINLRKNKINQLQNELKEEKVKNSVSNNNKQNDKSKKHKSMSEIKSGPLKENKNSSNSNNNTRLEEENRNLKKKIEELKETISKLKSNNDSLFKTNEKLLKEKNNLKNELLKEKNTNSTIGANSSIDNTINNELFNSQSKSNKKTKKLNKTKTSMEPLFNGNSLLLLKKIQDENKELAKQLKDFNSKNFQLELSIKGINTGEVGSTKKNRKSNTSMLSNFTNQTRNELKNIEKKYGLDKK